MTKPDVVLNPAGLVRRLPLKPEELQSTIIAQRDMFVLAHIGIPQVDISTWTLDVGGEVATPLRLTYEELRRFPKHTVESFHQGAGFPRRPDLPTRRVVNVVWGGAPVCDVAAAAGVKPNAHYLWAYGLDRGPFEGKPDHYAKDLPLQRLHDGSWLLAYEVNGEPLTREHGFPVRLVAPGFYGTNCVKWISRIAFSEQRCPGTFTQVLYNDPVKGSDERRPVWEAGPESVIVAPHDRAQLAPGHHKVWGWAWGSKPITRVEVSCDGGATWGEARLESRRQWSWQRFSFAWDAREPRQTELRARAIDADARVQPERDARNAIHCIDVTIAPA
jgi:DMSO/TMAO reductase YedYZ molybdopterin-dependent catalytic subunit